MPERSCYWSSPLVSLTPSDISEAIATQSLMRASELKLTESEKGKQMLSEIERLKLMQSVMSHVSQGLYTKGPYFSNVGIETFGNIIVMTLTDGVGKKQRFKVQVDYLGDVP